MNTAQFSEDDAVKLLESEERRLREEEECEHDFDPDEGFTCLNCGKDGTEEVMSRAYDRAKDLRKYGH